MGSADARRAISVALVLSGLLVGCSTGHRRAASPAVRPPHLTTSGSSTAPSPTTTQINAPPAVSRLARVGGPPPSAGATAAQLGPLAPPDPGWIPLATLNGAAGARSAVFGLKRGDTQLRYRSAATSLHVYLVDAAKGLVATAGYANVDCAGPCADLMVLTDRPGDYYLQVRSQDGPWEVVLEQHP